MQVRICTNFTPPAPERQRKKRAAGAARKTLCSRGRVSYNAPMAITNEQFDRFVTQAIESIEPDFRCYFDEVPVVVQDRPEPALCRAMNLPDATGLLGLFRGLPLSRRSVSAHGLPSQIVLYRQNLLALSDRPDDIRRHVRRTLIHELGHYLGFSEKQLREHHF